MLSMGVWGQRQLTTLVTEFTFWLLLVLGQEGRADRVVTLCLPLSFVQLGLQLPLCLLSVKQWLAVQRPSPNTLVFGSLTRVLRAFVLCSSLALAYSNIVFHFLNPVRYAHHQMSRNNESLWLLLPTGLCNTQFNFGLVSYIQHPVHLVIFNGSHHRIEQKMHFPCVMP